MECKIILARESSLECLNFLIDLEFFITMSIFLNKSLGQIKFLSESLVDVLKLWASEC